jgi:L-2-hydroxycarboxylate dehydrogenase (NAD+)
MVSFGRAPERAPSIGGGQGVEKRQVRVSRTALEAFCGKVFRRLGLSEEDAGISASVIVAADAMGIASHGVGRLHRWVDGLKGGLMLPDAPMEVLLETPSSLVLHAHGGMGAPVSVKAMRAVIGKARANGSAFACVKDSNHFGIAGYYARMALKEDMIGIAMTNTAALGVPTFGRTAVFGTNPLAFAAPAGEEHSFVLDMSTTVVPRGKLELFDRTGRKLPAGWAVDKTGRSAQLAHSLFADMMDQAGGGILPLGGRGTLHSGHKGYGLAVMVDILCAVLCGAPFGSDVIDTPESHARVSHFFGALRIGCFRDPRGFRLDMDRMLRSLRTSPAAEGEERVYYAGLLESEKEAECLVRGVPLTSETYRQLCAIGADISVEVPPVL